MKKEDYLLLYEKYYSGNCTEKEKQIFEQYVDDFSLDGEVWEQELLGDKDVIIERIYKSLQKSIDFKRRRWYLNTFWTSAAALIIVVFGVALFFIFHTSQPVNTETGNINAQNKILPGGRKAILTLQDGSQVILDDSKSGLVAHQGTVWITKNKTGEIVYNNSHTDQQTAEIYNTISTPRGAETRVLLPDGTEVWLNAASSIKFPVVFSDKYRRVQIQGEAYLEVKKNKAIPFIVEVSGNEIEVLGTHFNINAYEDQHLVKTTLLEGSVRLRNGNNIALLLPGQAGVSLPNGRFQVADVNVQDEVAWKDGYFVFSNENIVSIMTKAARWYDVEVEYIGSMKGKEFFARVPRYESITELLKNLELTKNIHFKIDGRRVIVMAQ